MENEKPSYLYDPTQCPCPRGEKVNCPRYRSCEDCIRYHRTSGNPHLTACEKKAGLTPENA